MPEVNTDMNNEYFWFSYMGMLYSVPVISSPFDPQSILLLEKRIQEVTGSTDYIWWG